MRLQVTRTYYQDIRELKSLKALLGLPTTCCWETITTGYVARIRETTFIRHDDREAEVDTQVYAEREFESGELPLASRWATLMLKDLPKTL